MDVFIVGRPYQLFNTISFLHHYNIVADLFIVNEYQDAENDYKQVIQSGFFQHVYLLKTAKISTRKMIKKVLNVITRTIIPKRFITKNIIEGEENGNDFFYDHAYFSSFSPYALALLNINKQLKIDLMEDGLGTYIGEHFSGEQSRIHRIINKLTGIGNEQKKVESVFLYRPDLVLSKLPCNVNKLPSISRNDSSLLNKYKEVFRFENEEYRKPFIVLSERMEGLNLPQFDLYAYLFKAFEKAGIARNKICYRLHPAEKTDHYKNRTIVEPREMWELLCLNYINDNSVLITVISTAAFSPSRIFKTEPVVILLFRVVGITGEMLENAEKLAESLKQSYNNKERIIVPNSIDELIEKLVCLNNRTIL